MCINNFSSRDNEVKMFTRCVWVFVCVFHDVGPGNFISKDWCHKTWFPPDIIKLTMIVPILKSKNGDIPSKSNYRPLQ